jgi:hypothetical protein
LPLGGMPVVLGMAGSGKSTTAIHRAAFVADERADHGSQRDSLPHFEPSQDSELHLAGLPVSRRSEGKRMTSEPFIQIGT